MLPHSHSAQLFQAARQQRIGWWRQYSQRRGRWWRHCAFRDLL